MKVILIDDDIVLRVNVKNMLSKIPGVDIVGEFDDAKAAYRFLITGRADVVILDIKMPGENGIDFARKINSEFEDMDIIFLTAYKDFALEAFDVCAFDYILKPVSQERLVRSIKRAVHKRKVFKQGSDDDIKRRLIIQCFGRINIINDKGDLVKFNSNKSTELFLYLIMNHGRFVSKWNIIEDIFRGMQRQNAETYLNTAVYKLRKGLEPLGIKDAVISGNGSYMVDVSNMYIDFIDFENRANGINTINESNVEEALKTEGLFGGDFFGDKGFDWSLFERERISELYCRFAKKLADYFFEKEDYDQSLKILRRIVLQNEFDEEVHSMFMRAFAAKNDKVSLVNHFERYTRMLQKEFRIMPTKTISSLYTKLRKSIE